MSDAADALRTPLLWRIATPVAWVAALLTTCYYAAHRPHEGHKPRRTIWAQNAAHRTPFALNAPLTSVYWIALWLLQLWYAALLVVLRFAYIVIDWWVERIVVTDKRFMLITGVFTNRVAMMPIGKVTDLTYERTATGRMFGYGTLIVESAGQIQALNRIEFLPRPELVYDAISELVFGDKQAQSERFSMIKAQRAARGKKLVP